MTCPMCFSWNAPLNFSAERTVQGFAVAMRYEAWLLYRFHVEIHQKDRWGGEIDQFQGDIMQFVLQKAA